MSSLQCKVAELSRRVSDTSRIRVIDSSGIYASERHFDGCRYVCSDEQVVCAALCNCPRSAHWEYAAGVDG